MPELNMQAPATVSWSETPLTGDMHNGTGGFSRHFNTLAEAAAFASSELPERFRFNAWISTEGHTFKPAELKVLASKAAAEEGADE